MNKERKIFLIAVLSLFFLCGAVFAEYSNDVPTPTVIAPPSKPTSPPPAPTAPPPATPSPEKPRIRITVPDFPETHETTPYTTTGANVIVRVYESGTNKPISGATVKWYGVNHTTGATSDFRGEANLKRVPLGEAKIRCNAAGHDYNSKVVWVEGRSRTEYFDIYLNKTVKTTPSVETPPIPTVTPKKPEVGGKATVSGTVYDKATRQPISGVAVKAYNAVYKQDLIKDVKTDQSGRYAIDNCPLDAAIKIMYGKPGYIQQDIPCYIPKVATVYTQDIYLEKGKVETKKPKETKKETMGEKSDLGTTQRALTVLNADITVISFTVDGQFVNMSPTLPIGDGMHDLSVVMRNMGPEDITGEVTLTITKDGTSISTAPVTFETTGRDVPVSTRQPFTPGYYELDAVLTLPEDTADTYEFNNHLTGWVTFKAEDPVPPPPVEPHNVDIEMIDFTIDGQSVEGNPTILKRDGPHELIATIRNNGPDATTDLSYASLAVDGIQQGPSVRCDTEANESRTATVTWQQPLDLGEHELWAHSIAPAMDRDDNFDNNGKRGTVKIVESLPPPDGGEEARQIDLGLLNFTANGQVVNTNPVVRLLPGNRVDYAMDMINYGPNTPRVQGIIDLRKIRVDNGAGSGELGFANIQGSLNVMFPYRKSENVTPGVYDVTAELKPGPGDSDNVPGNNTISGRVTFVAEDAGVGPEGHTDVQLIDFLVDGRSITTNPAIQLVDNVPVVLSWTARNNGPDDASGVCNISLTAIGVNETYDSGLRDGIGVATISSSVRPFIPGGYNLRATLNPAAGDTDDNMDNNTVQGLVNFAAPAGGGPAGERKIDLEVTSFTVEGQPVHDNPRIELPADSNIDIKVEGKNNGRDETMGPSELHFAIIDQGVVIPAEGDIPFDLQGEPGRIVGYANREQAEPGVYTIIAAIGPGPNERGVDSDLGNNGILGTITLVAHEEDADAGPPDGGQPDGGQPDGGQPDGGQPDGGQPGGWNLPGGVVAGPGGAGPIQLDAGLFGGGAPQQMAAPAAIAEAPVMEVGQPSPVVHPEMGRGPEFVKDFIGQVMAGKMPEAKEEEKEEEESAVGKEKNKILWLIALLSGIGLFIILAVIARKKKKRNEV